MNTAASVVQKPDSDQTQRQYAYQSLRKALILRRVPEGRRLREPEWTQRLGVNRTALREALARLHSEGLVVEGEKTGYFVPTYRPEDIEEIIEMRLMIESTALAHIVAMRQGRRDFLRELRRLCDDLEWIIQRGYSVELIEADHLFHEQLVTLSGGKRLTSLHRCLPQPPLPHEMYNQTRLMTTAQQIVNEHRALLDAIQNGRLDSAQRLLERHYRGQVGPHPQST